MIKILIFHSYFPKYFTFFLRNQKTKANFMVLILGIFYLLLFQRLENKKQCFGSISFLDKEKRGPINYSKKTK